MDHSAIRREASQRIFDVNELGLTELSFKFDGAARHRIHSAWMKGMATQNSLCRQPQTLSDTITLNRLVCIFRAGGIESASWAQVGRYSIVIHFKQYQNQLSHDQDYETLPKISSKDKKVSFEQSPAASFFAIRWISQQPAILCRFNLKNSLTNRLILLRVTALPTFFDTVIPRRVLSKRPGLNVITK